MINRRDMLKVFSAPIVLPFLQIRPTRVEYVDLFVETDIVPILLTPGEFRVPQSALNKIGTVNLVAINKVYYKCTSDQHKAEVLLSNGQTIEITDYKDIVLDEVSEVFKISNPSVKKFYVYNFWYNGRVANQLATTEKLEIVNVDHYTVFTLD